ncbi:hypothetical protein H072_2588 [Dactylellina haptotyla CBS 200.50]|uniref:Uncharacterized protein n=1 Tax=Dactylellina haptotyla (strain CBS 200.50) TaxID=1284197 RepID=S8BVB7_DACHA|nr:hypothetical protein H072_2588 [Dactylellina haptotyla CBS 200.50]
MSVSSIKIYINSALENLDSPYRVDQVEPALQQAEQRLPNISPDDAAPLIAQIAEIRAKLDNMVSPHDARQVSAAEGKIRQARDFIDTNYGQLNQSAKDFVEELFKGAIQFLDQIEDARKAPKLKAPVLAQIDQIRAQYGTSAVAAPVPPPPPPSAPKPEPSSGYYTAKSKVFWANEYFTTPGRIDQTEPELAQAENLINGDASQEADDLRAQIAGLRDKLADMIMPADEACIRAAQRDVQAVRDYMDQQRAFLDKSDTKQYLDGQLQKVIDQGLSKIQNPRKGDQLKAPILAEIAQIRSQLNIITQTYPPPPPPPAQNQAWGPPQQQGWGAPQPQWNNQQPPAWNNQQPQWNNQQPQWNGQQGYNQQPQGWNNQQPPAWGAPPQPQAWGPPQPQQQQWGPPQTSRQADPTPAALSYDDQDRLNRAKRSIGQARNNIESRRMEGVENLFFDATNIMAPVDPSHKDPLMAEIEQLRKDLENTRLEESTRRLRGELDRKLSRVEMDRDYPDRIQYSISSFKERLEEDEVRNTLSADMYNGYKKKLADVIAAGDAHVKNEAMSRATPALEKLREKIATNPFLGIQGYEVNRVDSDIKSMRWQVEREINKLPEDDEDRKKIAAELEAVDAKVTAYSNEWEKAGIYEEVRRTWKWIYEEVKEWEQEEPSPDPQPLEEPRLPQTRLAIHRVEYYLYKDTSVQRTRDENPGDSVIAEVDREALALLDGAGNKMAEAYNKVLEAAENMEFPVSDRYTREKPSSLKTNAELTFQDTKYGKPVVERIKALEKRWEDEMEAIQSGRKNLGETLSQEAVQKWPSIVAAIPNIVADFDPSSAKPGDAVHLNGVYNRSGWDFDGNQYGFSMRYNGVPLGGIYEGYINKAMDHAAYEQKLTIDDHKKWDLVGVVLGPGSISERTKRTIRIGMDTHEVEEWIPINCLRLRIIAIRAGPVLAGPPN